MKFKLVYAYKLLFSRFNIHIIVSYLIEIYRKRFSFTRQLNQMNTFEYVIFEKKVVTELLNHINYSIALKKRNKEH